MIKHTHQVSSSAGTGGHPPPPRVPHCFTPKMLILYFDAVFSYFAQIVPPPQVQPIWETLYMHNFFAKRNILEKLLREICLQYINPKMIT